MRIALLEDDLSQAKLVERWLTHAGLETIVFNSGTAFREGLVKAAADLIIIDWMLPDDDGLAVLVWLRETLQCKLPVMFATTRAEEASLVTALDNGADDYLIKPLRQSETIARVNALLRRGPAAANAAGTSAAAVTTISLGSIVIDPAAHRATRQGVVVDLTDREMELAVYMLRNHGRLLTRQELLENVWRTSASIITRTVDTHISRLRAKLGLTSENGFDLSTVYHKGYRLEYRPAAMGAAPT
jgi:two-component system, OmpR family, response regulator RegX3